MSSLDLCLMLLAAAPCWLTASLILHLYSVNKFSILYEQLRKALRNPSGKFSASVVVWICFSILFWSLWSKYFVFSPSVWPYAQPHFRACGFQSSPYLEQRQSNPRQLSLKSWPELHTFWLASSVSCAVS